MDDVVSTKDGDEFYRVNEQSTRMDTNSGNSLPSPARVQAIDIQTSSPAASWESDLITLICTHTPFVS